MICTTREWLVLTRSIDRFWEDAAKRGRDYALEYKGHYPNRVRPKVKCADGFEVSIQAGEGLYCEPRVNLEDGMYDTVELGYPNQEERLIAEYAEDPDCPTSTVYAQVPVSVVDALILKHGGIVNLQEVNLWLRNLGESSR